MAYITWVTLRIISTITMKMMIPAIVPSDISTSYSYNFPLISKLTNAPNIPMNRPVMTVMMIA